MPHITEELYQIYFKKTEKKESIHITSWPIYDEKKIDQNSLSAGKVILYALEHARRSKSEQQKSLKAPLKRMFIQAKIPEPLFATLSEDIKAATTCTELDYKRLPPTSEIDILHEIE